MSLIRIKDLSKKYNHTQLVKALDGISFEIEEAEIVSIIGPSGAGKSTLLSVVGGLNPPSSGKVVVDDFDIYNLSIEKLADFRREYYGFVFQEFQLVPYLTAIENTMLPLVFTDFNQSEQTEMAKAVLDQVGLASKYDRLPTQLSGGEQERVAIARALVNEPPIVFADEPTGSLDSRTGQEIMNLFQNLNYDLGLTVLVVTHNPENIKYTERVISLKDGKIEDNNYKKVNKTTVTE